MRYEQLPKGHAAHSRFSRSTPSTGALCNSTEANPFTYYQKPVASRWLKRAAKFIGTVLLVAVGLVWLAVATDDMPSAREKERDAAPSSQTLRMVARDAFACPGMHANWLDASTVQCLKEMP